MLRLGLIVNPLAGLGGPAGLKGSDGTQTVTEARARGSLPLAGTRAQRVLAALADVRDQLTLLTWGGAMGAEAARAAGFDARVLGTPEHDTTSAEDTRAAGQALASAGVDLLLFVGGDGTARDLCDVLPERQLALGIPAGVKMHSGVYAVTPEAAAELVKTLLEGELLGAEQADVRDIDEAELRAGRVNSRWYGTLWVPAAPHWVQHTKIGGLESEPLVLEEIAAWVEECMDDHADDDWIIGPGSTTAAIMERLQLPGTLLGVDLLRSGEVIASDTDAATLLRLTEGRTPWLVITIIGGQGHVLGRGNQQLGPQLLRRIPRERLLVVATRSKLKALDGRPLWVDSGDPVLDQSFSGYLPVLTGYDEWTLYPVGCAEAP